MQGHNAQMITGSWLNHWISLARFAQRIPLEAEKDLCGYLEILISRRLVLSWSRDESNPIREPIGWDNYIRAW